MVKCPDSSIWLEHLSYTQAVVRSNRTQGTKIMNIKKHMRFIEAALHVAEKSNPRQKQRLGCIIVQKGIPVGIGFNNMTKTHPRAVQCSEKGEEHKCYRSPYVHAELAAMIGVDAKKLKNAIAYVGRIKRDRPTGMAKPCIRCHEQLERMGIKEVFYSTEIEGVIGYLNFRTGEEREFRVEEENAV